MTKERQVQETIARCLNVMIRYHDDDRSAQRRALMVDEVHFMATVVKELGLSLLDTEERILQPLGTELLARYGYEVGPRIYAEFLQAYDNLPTKNPGAHARAVVNPGHRPPTVPPPLP